MGREAGTQCALANLVVRLERPAYGYEKASRYLNSRGIQSFLLERLLQWDIAAEVYPVLLSTLIFFRHFVGIAFHLALSWF